MTDQMTEKMRRVFLAAGCDPACHTCESPIPVGASFALIPAFQEEREDEHTETVEVMVCGKCKNKPLPEEQQAKARALAMQRKGDLTEKEVAFVQRTIGTPRGWGCFVVGGKIVGN